MPTTTDPVVRRYSPASGEPALNLRDFPAAEAVAKPALSPEVGGRRGGPEPTRYGDWEKQGRCIDF